MEWITRDWAFFFLLLIVIPVGAWLGWRRGGWFHKEVKSPGPGPQVEPAPDLPEVRRSKESWRATRDLEINTAGQELQNLYGEKGKILKDLQGAREGLAGAQERASAVSGRARMLVEQDLRNSQHKALQLQDAIHEAQPGVLDREQRLEAARQEVQRLEAELQTTRQSEHRFSDQRADAQLELDVRSRQHGNAEWEVQFTEDRLTAEEDRRRQAETDLEAARQQGNRREIQRWERDLPNISRGIQRLEGQLAGNRRNFNVLERQVRDASQNVLRLDQQLQTAQQEVRRLEQELIDPCQEVQRLEGELQTALAAAQPTLQPLEQQLNLAQQEVRRLEQELENLRQRDAGRAELRRLQRKVSDLEQGLAGVDADIQWRERRAHRLYPHQFNHLG